MNPNVTTEILRLKQEIARASEWVGELGKQVNRLEALARQAESETTAVSPVTVDPPRAAPAPPPLPKRSTTPVWRPADSLKPGPVAAPASIPAAPSPVSPQPQPAMAPKSGDSMEWRLGSYWLVRIGIVILLTGVVFLGNFVWKTYLPHLGHWGKLGFIALGSGALVVAGGRLERRKPDLQGYGRVLTAGAVAGGTESGKKGTTLLVTGRSGFLHGGEPFGKARFDRGETFGRRHRRQRHHEGRFERFCLLESEQEDLAHLFRHRMLRDGGEERLDLLGATERGEESREMDQHRTARARFLRQREEEGLLASG